MIENSAGTGVQLLGNNGSEFGTRLENVLFEGPASSQGVGIDVDTQLSDCRIIAHCKNLAKGLDLAGGSIGARNVIWLTADAGVLDLAKSLGTWDASNDIRLQGMKVKGGISNVTTGTQTRITSNGHGLSNGMKIAIDGVRGVAGVNSTSTGHVREIVYVDSNNFDLSGNPGSGGPYEAGTGWWGEWQK